MSEQKAKTNVQEPSPTTGTAPHADDAAESPRRYSKRYRPLQEFERHASKGVHRLVQSVEAGIAEWRKATDRSARKRKDGALRDALENSARAVSKQIRVASRAPKDAARALRSLKIGKALRRALSR